MDISKDVIPHLRGHSVCISGSEIFVFGGRSEDGNHQNATWMLSGYSQPERMLYKKVEGVPEALPRSHHSVVVVDDKMFVFGGILDSIFLCPQQIPFLNLSNSSWDYLNTSGKVPLPTSHNASCLSPSGSSIYLLGGVSASGECNSSLYELNLKTNCWIEIKLSIPFYWGHTLSVVGNCLLLIGGIEFNSNVESEKLWCIDCDEYSVSLKECPAVTATHRFSKTDARQHDLDLNEVLLKPFQRTTGPNGWTELYKQVRQLDGSYESILGWVPSNHIEDCYIARAQHNAAVLVNNETTHIIISCGESNRAEDSWIITIDTSSPHVVNNQWHWKKIAAHPNQTTYDTRTAIVSFRNLFIAVNEVSGSLHWYDVNSDSWFPLLYEPDDDSDCGETVCSISDLQPAPLLVDKSPLSPVRKDFHFSGRHLTENDLQSPMRIRSYLTDVDVNSSHPNTSSSVELQHPNSKQSSSSLEGTPVRHLGDSRGSNKKFGEEIISNHYKRFIIKTGSPDIQKLPTASNEEKQEHTASCPASTPAKQKRETSPKDYNLLSNTISDDLSNGVLPKTVVESTSLYKIQHDDHHSPLRKVISESNIQFITSMNQRRTPPLHVKQQESGIVAHNVNVTEVDQNNKSPAECSPCASEADGELGWKDFTENSDAADQSIAHQEIVQLDQRTRNTNTLFASEVSLVSELKPAIVSVPPQVSNVFESGFVSKGCAKHTTRLSQHQLGSSESLATPQGNRNETTALDDFQFELKRNSVLTKHRNHEQHQKDDELSPLSSRCTSVPREQAANQIHSGHVHNAYPELRSNNTGGVQHTPAFYNYEGTQHDSTNASLSMPSEGNQFISNGQVRLLNSGVVGVSHECHYLDVLKNPLPVPPQPASDARVTHPFQPYPDAQLTPLSSARSSPRSASTIIHRSVSEITKVSSKPRLPRSKTHYFPSHYSALEK